MENENWEGEEKQRQKRENGRGGREWGRKGGGNGERERSKGNGKVLRVNRLSLTLLAILYSCDPRPHPSKLTGEGREEAGERGQSGRETAGQRREKRDG